MQRVLRLFAVFALALTMLALTSPVQAATPTACNGIPATITGTPGDDVIPGTPGDDVILGLGGSDVIDGGGGDDIICGGSGDDTIKGGGGNDVAYGASGNDDLAGGNGRDDLFGGVGDDTLRGNKDDDNLVGGTGNDLLKGGYGDDTISGNDGDDRGFGGPGTDNVAGGPGADRLSGAGDDDELRGNGGDDILAGEAGDDLLYGGADSDTADGGIGFDRCMGTEFPIDCEDDDLNDPPVAMNDEFGTDEDQATGGTLLADNGNGEDYDPNGHRLTVVAVEGDEAEVDQSLTLPSGAEIVVNADGSFTYDPNGVYEYLNVGGFAVDTFEYTISDPKGETGTATVAVRIDGVNDAPEAVDDEAATNEDAPVAIDVLDNDSDVDSPISISDVTDRADGAVELIDGELVYTPNENFNGQDSFTYEITDGEFESTATVTVNVDPINDLPIAADDLGLDTNEDTPVWINVLANDSDVEDDATDLTITISTGPANGSVALVQGGVQYTPNLNSNGPDSFTYEVTDTDGGTSAESAVVEIEVLPINDAPVAEDDGAGTPEDTSVSIDVLDNDSDIDSKISIGEVGDPSYGTVELGDGDELVYTPNKDFFGEDTFEYTITDGEFTDTAKVKVIVGPVNDAPVAVDDTGTVDEDDSVIIDVTANDTDVEGDDLTPVLGVVTNGGAVVNPDGTVTFTPTDDFFGEATITYTADDRKGGISESATVTITVNGTPDDPVAEDDEIAAVENGPVVTGNLLTNDGDVDGDEPTVTAVDGRLLPFEGSRTETLANGAIQVFWNGDFIFTPDESLDATPLGGSVVDFITYVIDDGTGRNDSAIATVTVTGQNDDPVAGNDPDEGTYATDEETPITLIDLLDNDSDVDSGDILFVSGVDETSFEGASLTITQGGDVLYDPTGALDNLPLGSTVVDTFTYTVADGNGGTDTATVSITVSGLNDDPNGLSDDAPITEDTFEFVIDVLANDTDPDDGETATLDVTGIVLHDAVGQITILPDDTIRYRPGDNFADLHDGESADVIFEYILEDVSGGSVQVQVGFTVAGINEPWDAVDDPNVQVDEDDSVDINVLANDGEDEETDTPIVTIVPESGPSNGSVGIANNIITYTPNPNFDGTDLFDYQVDDGFGGTDTATVTITVNAVNDAPVAVTDTPEVGEDDGDTVIDVLLNDTDVENEKLSVVSVDDTDSVGIVSLNEETGAVSYDPDGQFEELDDDETDTTSFTYVINDGTDDSAPGTVTVTINGANDAPIATNDSGELDEDSGSVEIDVLFNDTDVDMEDLSIASFVQPDNGDVTEGNGGLVYTPDEHFNGKDTFTYVASDGTALSESATVTITVNAVNDAPVAVTDTPEVGEDDGDTVIDVLLNDTDVENEKLSVVSVDDTDSVGIVSLNEETGAVSYDPDGQFEELDDDETDTTSFTYVINDGTDDSAPGTVTVTINGANDAPIATNDSGELDEDSGSVEIDVLFNDTDVDMEDLSIASFVQPDNGDVTEGNGGLVYTPDEHFNGKDTFTYVASDGTALSESATVTITVNAVNDAPVAVTDSDDTDEDNPVDVDVLFNDSDTDKDELTPIVVTPPSNGSAIVVDIDGSWYIRYTPDENYNDPDSFTYKVNDGTVDSNTATVTITVNAVNDAPVAVADTPEVGEDDGDTVIDVLLNDIDAENDPRTVVSIDDGGTTGTVSFNEETGAVSYDPDGQFEELDDGETDTTSFTYVINDGTNDSAPGTVTVTINGANDAPTATDDSGEGYVVPTGASSLTTPSVLDNDTDVEDDELSIVEWDVDGTAGLVTYNSDGTFTYEPPTGQGTLPEGATDSWSYTVSDGDLESTARVTVVFNTVPEASDDLIEAHEDDGEIYGSLLDNDSDADDDELTATPIDQTLSGVEELTDTEYTIGQILVDEAGDYVLFLDEGLLALETGETVSDSFTYEVDDGYGGVDTAEVVVTVHGYTPIGAFADEFVGFAYESDKMPAVLGYATHNDAGANLTVTHVDGSTFVSNALVPVTDGGAGEVNVLVNWTGRVSLHVVEPFAADVVKTFTYTIEDDRGFSATATVSVTIYGNVDLAANDSYPADGAASLSDIGNVLGNDAQGVTITRAYTSAMVDWVLVPVAEQFPGTGRADIKIYADGTIDTIVITPFTVRTKGTFSYVVEDAVGRIDSAQVTVHFVPPPPPPA